MPQYKFINRDLSWLSFNYRVLEVAANKQLPLYERINFLAIYSSNLDEFYRVRVASYKRLSELPAEDKKNLVENPDLILRKINHIVARQQIKFGEIFRQEIIPELEKNQIIMIQNQKLHPIHQKYTEELFFDNLLPHLQPMLLMKKQIKPFLQNNALYLAIKLYKKKKVNTDAEGHVKHRKTRHAILKIPSHHYDRFIQLPELDGKHYIMFLDDIVKLYMEIVFPGYKVDSSFSFKLSRDADLLIEDEFTGDLIKMIENNLNKRETGAPSRFLYDQDLPRESLTFLRQTFNLSSSDLVKGARYHNFSDFFGLPNPVAPALELEPMPPLKVKELSRTNSIFKAIRKEERMLHFPYQSYEYIIRFLNEAAIDPKVEEIKATQYRVAENSAIVNALINAARNGKKVTVFVEVKARFDEASNLNSAREMRKAGVKIIYSIPGLKVHAKIALVIRKGNRENYAFLSTGNFNEKTAKLYADHGYLTCNEEIIGELKNLFVHLEDQTQKFNFNTLLIGQFNMKEEFLKKIDREIENVKKGNKGYLLLKMNGLQERTMIEKLYEASQKGVKIDLIIRGICCLKLNQPYSRNIRAIRIVDRFLEHARVFVFHNNGANEMYLSSADWMSRNLNRRIECAFPITKEEMKQEIIDILHIQLADNTSARLLDAELNNIPIEGTEDQEKIRAQYAIYDYLKAKE
ncbi:MAG: polyphosphate kinase 1 [Marinifilaceae bacterium]